MVNIDINNLSANTDKNAIVKKYLDGKNLDMTFLYSSDFSKTKILREFIETIFETIGLQSNWISRLILISDEINNNAIEYGSSKNDLNIMRIKTHYNKGDKSLDIDIEIEDTGRGKKHKKAKDMNIIKDKKISYGFDNYKSIRGRGLFLIIYRLVDNIYFKDSDNGGLIVGVKKKVKLS